MKRILTLMVLTVMVLAVTALPVSALSPGDPLGWVLNSDVTAYIDGYPIRSYNINGYTYIVAEDLISYGFNVEWRGSEAKLVIHTNRTAAPGGYTATYQHTANTEIPGTPAFQYLCTNITTWIDNKQITGYNIGGNTCICMDDLAAVFSKEYVWDPTDSSLRLTTAGGTTTSASASNELTQDDISIKLKIPRNGALNNYAQLVVTNNSDKVLILSEFAGINGYLCNAYSEKMVSCDYTETISYYRAILSSKRFDDKYYDMYLDNNSIGYIVMKWNGEQYYAEYGTDGITLFYKGNVNGPAN